MGSAWAACPQPRARDSPDIGGCVFISTAKRAEHAHEEPSTSWSAGGLVQGICIGDKLLDFDEVNGSEGLVVGREGCLGGQGTNRFRSFSVLQEQRKVVVRSDRHGGESRMPCLSGNLPRGEERSAIPSMGRWVILEKRSSVGRTLVKDMGVQTGNSDKDELVQKDTNLEVSVLVVSSGKAEPEHLAQNQEQELLGQSLTTKARVFDGEQDGGRVTLPRSVCSDQGNLPVLRQFSRGSELPSAVALRGKQCSGILATLCRLALLHLLPLFLGMTVPGLSGGAAQGKYCG
ncbi:hypothetical protein NDU88_006241 [Pleurodeles waltl]|uniref:Uncharacterized protein n=1 Tax=Pleurodeles waltl TaxID=8319 RepID=A0AAV7X3M5_PLEWA|nr:hypothetical protein NDU88_006241 [Pleurodeles waltl]